MFLTQQDYKGVCDEDTLDVLTQSDEATRQRAEQVAMEEVASYLRSRYDIAKAYAAQGEARNPFLVQITANIALYYLVHWLPQFMGIDARKQLYDDAILWLKQVQGGKAMPDLPTYQSENGDEDINNPIRYGGMSPSQYDY